MNDNATVNGAGPSGQKGLSVADANQVVRTALLAQADLMLKLGVPLNLVFAAFLDVACNLISAVEPKPIRDTIVQHMLQNLPAAIGAHYEARHTRASGIIVPGKQ